MHGIAQLVGCDGEEFVARLEELLQLGDPRAQSGFAVRETAPQARVSTQIQLPPKIIMTMTACGGNLTRFSPQSGIRGSCQLRGCLLCQQAAYFSTPLALAVWVAIASINGGLRQS